MFTLKFLWLCILTNFRLSLALRGAFIITIFMVILKQSLFLVAWNFFFEKYKIVQGWNFNDMLFMYGIVGFAMGSAEVFFSGLKELPRIIETNQLDTFLLQPKNVVLNVALSKGDISAFGEVVAGIIFIFYSGYMVKAFPVILLILMTSMFFMFALLPIPLETPCTFH